jgi:hypothetical protein
MEKRKRGEGDFLNLLQRHVLLLVMIFLAGISVGVIGLVYITTSSAPLPPNMRVAANEAVGDCIPDRRYDAQYLAAEADRIQRGSVAIASTGVGGGAVMQAPGTYTPAPYNSGYVGTPPPTSVASMNPIGTPQPLSIEGTSTALAQTFLEVTVTQEASAINTATPLPTMTVTATPLATVPASIVVTPSSVSGSTDGVQIMPTPIDTNLRTALNAGEINDNEEWDTYLLYRRNFTNPSPFITQVDVTGRRIIRVTNEDGLPVLGAAVTVSLTDGTPISTGCTYATGETLFMPNAFATSQGVDTFTVRAEKDGVSVEANLTLSEMSGHTLDLTLAVAPSDETNLDVMFLFDATGSMQDEIDQITNNILYISEEIDNLPDDVNVRYGLVSYKDGAYPTQVWDFTPDVETFQAQLASLFTAGGSGETLNDGLDKALHAVQWRGGDTVKLVFLIGDEPPGIYEQHPSYGVSMMRAAEYGVKVHPVASSGLDLQGEYVFRQIAQATMGHFVFLTYEGGVPGTPGVQRPDLNVGEPEDGIDDNDGPYGEYTVDSLHEIVLGLIKFELDALKGA